MRESGSGRGESAAAAAPSRPAESCGRRLVTIMIRVTVTHAGHAVGYRRDTRTSVRRTPGDSTITMHSEHIRAARSEPACIRVCGRGQTETIGQMMSAAIVV